MLHQVGRNEPCPCGSGKKYKKCCISKGFTWVRDSSGNISRQLPMTDELRSAVERQRKKFVEKFGRDPAPDDLVFFDAPPLEHVEHITVEAMKRANVDPALIHAYEKTGLLVTEENRHLLPETDVRSWQAAIEEYLQLHPDSHGEEPGGVMQSGLSALRRRIHQRLRRLDKEALVALSGMVMETFLEVSHFPDAPGSDPELGQCAYCEVKEERVSDDEFVLAHEGDCPVPRALELADWLDDWIRKRASFKRISGVPGQKPGDACRCGSGKKYRSCCYATGFDRDMTEAN